MDKLIILTEPPADLAAPTVAELQAGMDITPHVMSEAERQYAELEERFGEGVIEQLSKLPIADVQRAIRRATMDVERGTRVNLAKDRSLRGKARRKARRAR